MHGLPSRVTPKMGYFIKLLNGNSLEPEIEKNDFIVPQNFKALLYLFYFWSRGLGFSEFFRLVCQQDAKVENN